MRSMRILTFVLCSRSCIPVLYASMRVGKNSTSDFSCFNQESSAPTHMAVFSCTQASVFFYIHFIFIHLFIFFNYLLFIIYYTLLLLLLFMHFLILFSITHVFAHMCVNRHVFSMIYFFCRLWPAPLHSASEDLGRRAAASGRGGGQGEGVFRLHMGGLGPAQEMGVRTAIQACA